MAKKPLPDQAKLNKLLRYEPATGLLFWRYQSDKSFCWNQRFADREALTHVNTRGYRRGRIEGHEFKAHRVIWKLVRGTEPEYIDHIDGDPLNNRLSNLRSVSHAENMRNQKFHREGRIALSRIPKPTTANTPTGRRLRTQNLSPKRPEALRLRATGMSYAKIAERLGVRHSTAYKWCQSPKPTF